MDDDEIKSSSNNNNNNNNGSATKDTVAEVTAIARNLFLSFTRKRRTTNNSCSNNSSNNNNNGISDDQKQPEKSNISSNLCANNEIDSSDNKNRDNRSVDLNKKSQKCDDSKNVFQRIKMKMELKIPSKLRLFTTTSSSTTTIVPTMPTALTIPEPNNSDPLSSVINENSLSKQQQSKSSTTLNNTDENNCNKSKPLTDNYRKYITKKWLEQDSGPNIVMFKACTEMLSHVWYWGEISRHDAQKQLTGKPNGSFLVRDSETNGSQFTLSFRIGNYTLHYRLQYRDNYWHFEELVYESIVEMIEDIMTRSTDEKFVCYVKARSEMQPPFPVILKYPISRYSKIPQLQELCRLTIQQYINPKQIENLPIPIKLQEYLNEKTLIIF